MVGDFSLADADMRYVGVDENDAVGMVVSRIGDVNGDSTVEYAIQAPDRDDGAGVLYLLDYDASRKGEFDVRLEGDAVRVGTNAGYSWYGGMAVGRGDVTGDGLADLSLASYYADMTGFGGEYGGVFVLESPLTGDGEVADASTVFTTTVDNPDDFFGLALATEGDLDADGTADTVIGSGGDQDAFSPGLLYVYFGPVVGATITADADLRIEGEHDLDWFGASASTAGDVDGDGTDDLLVGATHEDSGGGSAGAAYLFHPPLDGVTSADQFDVKFVGENGYDLEDWGEGDLAGARVAIVGDMDGDTRPDLLITASNYGAPDPDFEINPLGAVYLVTEFDPGVNDLADVGIRFEGDGAFSHQWQDMTVHMALGRGDSTTGDFNCDGHSDLVVTSGSSWAFVFYSDGVPQGRTASAADAVIWGENTNCVPGDSLASPGDLDGDGCDDLLIGTPGCDLDSYYYNHGAVYVVLGKPLDAGGGGH